MIQKVHKRYPQGQQALKGLGGTLKGTESPAVAATQLHRNLWIVNSTIPSYLQPGKTCEPADETEQETEMLNDEGKGLRLCCTILKKMLKVSGNRW